MHYRRIVAIALLAGGLGCGRETVTPLESPPMNPATAGRTSTVEAQRLERIARRMALALRNPAIRGQIQSALARSRFRENKLHLQELVRGNEKQLLRAVAEESGDNETLLNDDLADAGDLEIYLPVPEHRARWSGEDNILVATSLRDGDVPIAFDVQGVRYELDPLQPPASAVISIVPSETDFSPTSLSRATCTLETCPPSDGGGGGGSGGGTPPAPRGIYLTQASIHDLKEDWLRGSPEVEVMFMGPLTDTTSMNLIACSNESSAAPRYYNQDKNSWTGNVLVADSSQLERVHRAYPPGTPWNLVRFAIAFWEDDTGRCQIATSAESWKNKLLAAGLTVLGGMVVLATDWNSPIDNEAWPFVVQLPLGLLGLIGSIGGNDDFLGLAVNRTVWNPLHPNDIVYTRQVLLDGSIRNGTATIVWR